VTPTTTSIPSLAACDWLRAPSLVRLFAAIEQGDDTAWVVGGAVRNALLGRPVADVDVATTAVPETVMARAAAAGLKPVPTGIDHGTVTVVVDGHPFEVTTLREDIETHGRHATVRFGRDWNADAQRRDFTMNALYATPDGRVRDLVGGIEDCIARRVRFIGRPEDRIREDYLRILRFFRFTAAYGDGVLDPDGMEAVLRHGAGLARLSRERVRQETIKLIVAPYAVPVIATMEAHGLLMPVVMRRAHPDRLARMAALEREAGNAPDAVRRLMALAVEGEADIARLREALRLTNAEVRRMEAILPARPDLHAHVALYRLGPVPFGDAVLVRAAMRPDWDGWQDVHALPGAWLPPPFELTGADALALGIARGPAVGEALAGAERSWIAAGFPAGREAQMQFLRAPKP